MRPLTDVTPKPLLRAGARRLIEYHIEGLVAAGIERIVINTAWLGDQIRTTLGNGDVFGAQISYSDEADGALETGGGIVNALPLLGAEPFVVISGDIWSEFPLRTLLAQPAHDDLGHLVLVPNPEYHTAGDFGLTAERVSESAVQKLTYGNIGVFRPELFAGCARGRLKLAPLLFDAAARGRLSGELFEGAWRNIGTPAQLTELDQQLQQQHL